MDMTRHDQIAVDLVGADEYMVLHADISHPLQFFAGEYTAGRVLRIAKDKEFCVGIGGISLKIFKVDLVMIGFQGEGTSHDDASVGGDRIVHRVVGRGKKENTVPRFCQKLNRIMKGIHNARGAHDPVRLDLPSMVILLPSAHGFEVCFCRICVTRNISIDISL